METLGGSDEEYNNLLKMSKRPHGVDHKMNFKKLKWQVAIWHLGLQRSWKRFALAHRYDLKFNISNSTIKKNTSSMQGHL